jgi:hypothetical protein
MSDEAPRAAWLLLWVAYGLALYHERRTLRPEDYRPGAKALSKLELALRREVDVNSLIGQGVARSVSARPLIAARKRTSREVRPVPDSDSPGEPE